MRKGEGVKNGDCETFVSDCHVRAAVELISHTWDPLVLSALRPGSKRRSDLIRQLSGVSDKVLTHSLRRLASLGVVTKTTGSAPAAAVYQLTPLGASFSEGPLASMAEWAAENQTELFNRHEA